MHYPFIALMPQWDFLNFLASEAKAFANFTLLMRTEVIGTIEEAGKITGVRARSPEGETEIKADLVIAADGRHSTVRASGGFIVEDIGAPMDVLWFRLSRQSSDPPQTLGRIDAGSIFVQLNRGDYWQCAYVIPKGSVEDVHRRGLDAFRAEIVRQAPFFADRIAEIVSFEDAKLLTVGIDRLTRWHKPGLICIGDAAHTMSPIGGVGINVAIQDALRQATFLPSPCATAPSPTQNLAAVQARRELPVRIRARHSGLHSEARDQHGFGEARRGGAGAALSAPPSLLFRFCSKSRRACWGLAYAASMSARQYWPLSPGARNTRIGMPSFGLSVTRCIGRTSCVSTCSKRKTCMRCASTIQASCSAKLAPTQTRGPAPNGSVSKAIDFSALRLETLRHEQVRIAHKSRCRCTTNGRDDHSHPFSFMRRPASMSGSTASRVKVAAGG